MNKPSKSYKFKQNYMPLIFYS